MRSGSNETGLRLRKPNNAVYEPIPSIGTSPRYRSKHTYEEVFRCFESGGFGKLRVLYEATAVQRRKPGCGLAAHLEEVPCVESQAS